MSIQTPTPNRRTMPLWPDAANTLGLSRSFAYRLAREGNFPVRVLHFGNRLLVSTSELDRYLNGDLSQTKDAS